jgi:pyruvate dehydrogenase E2 component (dihydrolipoamide acetyltransferase)
MNPQPIQHVVMPKWGLSMRHGRLLEWYVSEGDEVHRGDDLAEVESEKAVGVVEAVQEGRLRRLVARPGDDVPVGATIALLAGPDVLDEELDDEVSKARQMIEAGEAVDQSGPMLVSAEVDGRRVVGTVMGEGDEHVVLVHGYGGDRTSWDLIQEPLASRFRVWAIDLPGHGDSTKDVGDGSLETLAAALHGFLDEHKVPGAHLVGHSLGGAVATVTARRFPNRVRSLTLVASAGLGSIPDIEYLRGFAQVTTRRELKPLVERLFANPHLAARSMVDRLLAYKRLDGVDRVLNTLLATLLEGDRQAIDLSEDLRNVGVPVRIVWGAEDKILPVPDLSVIGGLPPLHTVPRCGHMVPIENPGAVQETVADAVGAAAQT